MNQRYFFNGDFIKNYNEESDDFPFLPKRMKIEKVKKLVANLHDKFEYVMHIRNWKQVLNHRLVSKFILWLNSIKMLG